MGWGRIPGGMELRSYGQGGNGGVAL